jgi:hypothetical protein
MARPARELQMRQQANSEGVFMNLEQLIRRRQDEIRGRPEYRRERFASWLRDKWLLMPTLGEFFLFAASIACFAAAAMQAYLIWIR